MNPLKTGKLFSLTVIVFASLSYGEGPSISARLSANQITLNESATLSIEINGLNNVQPPDLNLPDFNIQKAGQTQSYQWINGQTSSLITFNYVLTPIKTGTLAIPSLTLQHENKSYQTHPLTLTVREGTSAPPAAGSAAASSANSPAVPSEGLKPVFLTASLDKSKAYVGQQLILTIQFLRRPNIDLASRPRYQEPDLTGFIMEPLKQKEYTTTLNGSPYAVTELRYALFPTSDGDFAIGSAQVEAAVRTPLDPFDPNNFFQNFFNQGQVVKLTTRAIPVQVRSLPKTRPDQFSGAVGRFKLTAAADTKSPEVGKPFNLTLKLEGTGNIKSLREPQLPDIHGLRKYDPIASSSLNTEGKSLTGSKEIKIPFNPQVSGTIVIPALTYIYFDPDNHQFETTQSQPISLSVQPGTISSEDAALDQPGRTAEPMEGIRVIEKDIRFIKSGVARPHKKPLILNIAFWVLIMIPPFLTFVLWLATLYTRKRREQSSYFRNKEAWSQFKITLRQAKKHLKTSDDLNFYASLQRGLIDYLAAKTDLSSAGLLWDNVSPILASRSVSEEELKNLRQLWDRIDMARFGLSGDESFDRLDNLKQLESAVRTLEKSL